MPQPLADATPDDQPPTFASIEADAFKLACALVATLTGEYASCTRRSCRRAEHCTAAADSAYCRQPRVVAFETLASVGSEFLVRHIQKHPLPRPARERREASER
jgi:hypothetical protein